MNVGFTGTRDGMTPAQKETFKTILEELEDLSTLNHGDCVGADEQAHKIARKLGWFVTIHPPVKSEKRAFCKLENGVSALPPAPYLVRNQNIVDHSSMLVAVPKEDEEVMRSGTWATIRYARKQGKKIWIINPGGDAI